MKTWIFLLIVIALLAGNQTEGQKKARLVAISGTVTDTTLSPVSGVLIIVDGQESGAKTGNNGYYRVKIKPTTVSVGAYTSNLGSSLVMYEGQTVIDFILNGSDELRNFKPASSEGDKVVEIGYGTVRKKNMSSDIGYIDGKESINACYRDIFEMIKGRVPGVQVIGDQILIRGVNSILAETGPLFVVDGIVVSSIADISPNEVKSITVLKGSDAAIYGSRAAGGVIMITLRGAEKQH